MTRWSVLRLLLTFAAVVFVVLPPRSSQVAADGLSSAQSRARAVPLDIVWADPRNMMYSSGPTELERLLSPAAFMSNITVTYDAGFAAVPQAQAAFQAAVNIWRSVISSPVPIRINAFYQNLGNPNLLGSAGPSVLCTAPGGVSNTYYAAALADKLNGAAFCAALVGKTNEINANFNNTFTNWDFGTTGVPVAGKYSFMTVVLHEIGHGLGLYGSMSATGGVGSYRSVPDIYDRFAVTGASAPLLGFVNPSAALGSQLVSNDTFFNGPLARSQNSNSNPKLETHNFTTAFGIPSDNGWRQGSSYSHIDEVLYSATPNGLMTFALGQAEVYTDPGPIARGILADEGWGPATLGSSPLLTIDVPPNGGVVGATFTVSGWGIDRGAPAGTGMDQVHVYAYPAGGGAGIPLGVATYGQSRPDVGAAFGAQFTNSGFTFNASGLANGAYTLTLYGRSTVTGTFSVSASKVITVSGPVPNPAMSLDRPLGNGSSGTNVTVSGWAIDRGAPSGTGVDQVHVYAFPTGGGSPIGVVAAYGQSRPDVGAAFGGQFTNSGFSVVMNSVPAGTYNFTAYMHSTVSGTFILTATATNVTVNATTSNPQMMIDAPPAGASRARPFTISGWAVDAGAVSGPGIDAIHVWAFPVSGAPQFFVGVGTYGLSRPDVGAYIGSSQFNNSGYTITIDSSNVPAPGVYDFVVFAHSTVTGTFPIARIVRVNVS
jgi:hypothetical protein